MPTVAAGRQPVLNQGWYDNVLAVDPTEPYRVWLGGIDLFRSEDGGQSWGLASYWSANGSVNPLAPSYVHADQHVLVFHPNYNGTTNQTLYIGNDGGIFRTDNARAAVAAGSGAVCNAANSRVAFTSLNNGYGVTQFFHGAVYPDGKTYFGGTQDNGTVRGADSDGANHWREINGGDGGYVAVNPLNPNTLYAEFTGVSLRKSTNGGTSFQEATTGLNTNSLFIAPFAMDPSDPNRLWFGGSALYRTTNAATLWQQASNYLASGEFISAIAVAPTDANIVLAGDAAGYIYRTDKALTTTELDDWDAVKPRDGFVSGLTIDPADKQIAYATYSTFGDAHVWRTINGGQTWQSIDGSGNTGLPDIPVHCLVIDPSNTQRLYVGTDLGVFASLDGGATWAVENTGFANVVVEALQLNVYSGVTTLYAFTHGRGAWKVDVNYAGCNYVLNAPGQAVAAMGGTGNVNVTATAGACNWTARSNASWITVNSFTGTISGSMNFTVAANDGFAARFGTITIAGRSYTITQAGKEDKTAPTLRITAPTTQSSYTTTTGSVTLTVTSRDNDAISNISWRSDRGGSGAFTAMGGDDWVSNQINLRTGMNVLTVTAMDRSGNATTTTLTISLNAQTTDTTTPTLRITQPTSNATYITTEGLLTLEGTAADNRSVTHLLWSNERGGSGRAEGSGTWIIRNIPLQVGVNKITVTAYDSNANISQAVITVLSNPLQTTRFIAGLDFRSFGFNGDNRAATTAQLWSPHGLAFDASGNLYIADGENHRIRKVSPGGVITTIAGTGISGLEGDGGAATQATLQNPTAVAFDAAGNLYLADTGNHKIRKITPDGTISTFAGTGKGGYDGDGKAATAAEFNAPTGIAVAANGDVYIADYGNSRIRKVRASDGVIETVAGNGTAGSAGDGGDARTAQLSLPTGVAVDRQGNLYIADSDNAALRKVGTDGRITRFAGTGEFGYSGDGGAATAAHLGVPFHLAVDRDGSVLFTDEFFAVVRRVTSDGRIVTVFGNPNGLPQEGVAPTAYGLSQPRGLALDGAGNIYVADAFWQNVVAALALNPVATVESAGYTGPTVARDSLVTAFGNRLATTEAVPPAGSTTLPTTLAGTTVTIRDSQSAEQTARLLYVGPTQVNYLIPAQIAEGFATVIIRNALGETATGFIEIVAVAPGLFSANADGTGAAVGYAIRVRNGVQSRETIVTFNPTTNRFVTKPLDFDPATEALFIELYGTGIRNRSSQANVVCEVGGVIVPVEYASVAPGFFGLDQVNINIPASLDNRGEIDLVLTVEGRKTKTLRVNIR
ncbi:MAG: BACON domain-containing carbohydrate-binding protein [Blastocatellia bacterium]